MTDSHIGSTETPRNILEYLKALRLLPGDLDVEVKSAERAGILHVRQGQVIGAECGKLKGNGALLTLAAIGLGTVHGVRSEVAVEKNVSVTVSQIERFFAKLPSLPGDGFCNEEQTLHLAIRLFLQFRRKEAGVKLVEVLRSNRFYYPAWVWHSRLMTREESIKKALNEANKWGNCDQTVKSEVKKIESQLTGSADTVKRCIFCWSLIRAGEVRCGNCGGFQVIPKNGTTAGHAGGHVTGELQKTLSLYEKELETNPQNLRIVYCLCLGYYSLGKIDQARELISRALKISPKEPLFVRASALLQPVPNIARQEAVPREAAPQASSPKIGLVTPVVSADEKRKKADKTVLVVEDSKTARKVVSLVLGRKGYTIIEAATGTEALLAIEGVTPDLVLLDVMLPDMTGYEVLSAIRKKSALSEIPVVMLTGKGGAADRQKGMISGSNEYLTKPFDPAKLLSVLGKYLEPTAKTANVSSSAPTPVKHETVMQPAVAEPVGVKRETPAVVTRQAVSKPAVTAPVAVMPTVVIPKKKGPEKSVLVVEDSPTSRKVISMVLSRKGYLVYEAATGAEALGLVKGDLPHLILLDAMLPDMTGYDILALLKEDPRLKEIPVVMLTAKDSPLDREKGIRAGSAAYLTKPFNPDKLLSVIGSYI